MAQEIERKFLVDPDLLSTLNLSEPHLIEQAYIKVDKTTEKRIRRLDDEYYYTIKTGSGLNRGENEMVINQALYNDLLKQRVGNIIKKTRFVLSFPDNLKGELDVYDPSGPLTGLVVLEVEFPTEIAARNFKPPLWAGADVTENKAYKNQPLALNGSPKIYPKS